MTKKWVAAVTFMLGAFSNIVLAQSFFNTPATGSSQGEQDVKSTTSVTEMKDKIKKMGQQNLNNLSNEVNQQLSHPVPSAKSIFPPPANNSPLPSDDNAAKPAVAAPPVPVAVPAESIPAAAPATTLPAAVAPLPQPAPAATNTAPVTNTNSNPMTPSTILSKPVQNQDIYTGFGSGNSPNSGTVPNTNSNKTSNWDIKY